MPTSGRKISTARLSLQVMMIAAIVKVNVPILNRKEEKRKAKRETENKKQKK